MLVPFVDTCLQAVDVVFDVYGADKKLDGKAQAIRSMRSKCLALSVPVPALARKDSNSRNASYEVAGLCSPASRILICAPAKLGEPASSGQPAENHS